MALDKLTLKNDLKAALNDAESANNKDGVTCAQAFDKLADALAGVIDSYVKSAVVKVIAAPGQIAVTGTPAAQSNAAPIELQGTLE
jgi:hypothetical protein